MRWDRVQLAVILATLLGAIPQFAQVRPGPRPEIWKDDDMESVPEPEEQKDAMYYDFLHSTFAHPPKAFWARLGRLEPAWNVNAWDEVPDSGWYTNRNHLHPMTPEEIQRGPNRGPGPDLSKPLTVVAGKAAGITPGFRALDARGDLYFVKFDPPAYPELATGAEMVGTQFFYALGFNVPEEWIIHFRADQVRIGPEAKIWAENGWKRKMTQADLEGLLKRVYREPDGHYRATASLRVPGIDKGRFKFDGTRQDDLNDLIPHQHRRELRGLRLFCAWLNHDDIRAGNTLDFYTQENGRKFLRHYLQDFGSILGSDTDFPNRNRVGFSYILDAGQMAGPLFSLGMYQPTWREHPTPILYPSVGRFESKRFSPADWKANYPILSFYYMDNADAYWAAKIIMSFSEEQMRAAVKAGEYSDPRVEEYLVRTLVERQRKIGLYGFTVANPLDQFRISGVSEKQELEFEDLAVKYGFVASDARQYSYALSPFGEPTNLSPAESAHEPRMALGKLLKWAEERGKANSLFVLTLHTNQFRPGFKDRWVKVYLEREGSGFRVRGWERES